MYRVLQKKTLLYLFCPSSQRTALLTTVFLHYIRNMLVNTAAKYLGLSSSYRGIAEVRSLGLFSSNNRRSLNHRYSAFQCSYDLGHKMRTNDDQNFVQPILETKGIGKTASNDITSVNTKLLKLTLWIILALFSGEMAIQG